MIDAIESSALFAWPLAATFASLALVERVRTVRRRRSVARAVHEVRRPLQLLALDRATSADRGASRRLDAAVAALAALDCEINGAGPEPRCRFDLAEVARAAVERWRAPVVRAGRSLEFQWLARGCLIEAEPQAIARAIDNLIANSLEHGSGPIRIEGTRRRNTVRLHVADRGRSPDLRSPGAAPRRRRRDRRRGHGLPLVAEVAARHGGRFACSDLDGGSCAVIELPLAR